MDTDVTTDRLRAIRGIAMGAPSDIVLSETALPTDDQERLRRAAAASGRRIEALQGEFTAEVVEEALRQDVGSRQKPTLPAEAAKPKTLPAPAPPVLEEAALHGPLGDHVRLVAPHSEADPAAILVQDLVSAGAVIGRGPHMTAEATEHHARLFAVVVGASSKARKGTSADHVARLWDGVDPSLPGRRRSGLSSGEGLIAAVRDPTVGVTKDGEACILDAGVEDKRLLVVEGEFATVMSQGKREGNTLSAVLRDAWDGRPLATLTKSPTMATGAHACIAAHCTVAELRAMLGQTAMLNGFGNRFLWTFARRSKLLPHGGDGMSPTDLIRLQGRLREAVEVARRRGRVTWDPGAHSLWEAVYADLAEERDGLVGAMTARGEAQVLRLSLTFALLDAAPQVREDHLTAAAALWRYCAASVEYVFGEADPVRRVAERILAELRAEREGLPKSRLHDLFARHEPADRIDAALGQLRQAGLAARQDRPTAGRPQEWWCAV